MLVWNTQILAWTTSLTFMQKIYQIFKKERKNFAMIWYHLSLKKDELLIVCFMSLLSLYVLTKRPSLTWLMIRFLFKLFSSDKTRKKMNFPLAPRLFRDGFRFLSFFGPISKTVYVSNFVHFHLKISSYKQFVSSRNVWRDLSTFLLIKMINISQQ